MQNVAVQKSLSVQQRLYEGVYISGKRSVYDWKKECIGLVEGVHMTGKSIDSKN